MVRSFWARRARQRRQLRRRQGFQGFTPQISCTCEHLEDRTLLSGATDADVHVHAIFAPDTPRDYVNAHTDTPTDGPPAFQLNPRWSSTATNGSGLQQGDPTILTWSIVPDGTAIPSAPGINEPAAPSNLIAYLGNIYGVTTPDANYTDEVWFPLVQSIYDRWSELTGITFVYQATDDGASLGSGSPGIIGLRGDMRLSGHHIDGNGGTLAYNYYPQTGDMVVDTGDNYFNDTSSNSIKLRNMLAHEVGHGIGIQHVESSNAAFLMEPFINTTFDGPQFDDILGAHRHYGDHLEDTAGGNNNPGTAHHLGSLTTSGSLTIGTNGDTTSVAVADTDFVSIDGIADVDYYSFTLPSDMDVDVIVDPVGPTYNQGPQFGSQALFDAEALNNLVLEVIDGNGTSVLVTRDLTGAGGTEGVGFLSLGAGTYYVRVTGTLDNVQLYALTVRDAIGFDDHGNDAAGATNIAVPSVTPGVFEIGGDVDYFAFNAFAGAEYTFETTLTTLSDSTLTLYDTNGVSQLAFDDDGGAGLASLINWTAPASGTYYVKVQGFVGTDSGTYSLTAGVTGLPIALIGIDFDAFGSSPGNWTQVTTTTDYTEFDLVDESGNVTSIDAVIDFGDNFSYTFVPQAANLPIHDQSLAGLDGNIYGQVTPITITYQDLIPGQSYEIYVFGGDTDIGGTSTQLVTITGETMTTFSYSYTDDQLYINSTLGSNVPLEDFAEIMGADTSGEISIRIERTGASTFYGLAGLAIRAVEMIATGPFVVDTTADTVDANPGDGVAEDASGNTSLRAAIMEANALAGANEIIIPAGTYSLSITGTLEDGSASGDLDITDDLTITGAGAEQTIINGASIDRVLHVLGGTSGNPVELTLQDVTITGGYAFGSSSALLQDRGAGMFVNFNTQVTVDRVVFRNNEAPRTGSGTVHGIGGAIANSGNLTVLDSRFENNLATNDGGAIYMGASGASATILRTTFENNVSPGGGAIKTSNNLVIEDSLFVGNNQGASGQGNGGAINVQSGAVVRITNSTLSGNSSVFGGAIQSFGTVIVNGSTITGNSAGWGGGINTSGSLTIENSIVAGNTASVDGPDIDGGIMSGGHNLIGDTTDAAGFHVTDLLNVDPMLGPLADNGGPTLTHALLPGSPAIDAANTATAPSTDQRGVTRPQGAEADIGAFEAEPANSPTTLTVAIDMSSINENGGTATGTVTRTGSTTGAMTVFLTSSDESEATVPVSVVIPDGSDSVTFAITAVDDPIVDGTQTVTITAAAEPTVPGEAFGLDVSFGGTGSIDVDHEFNVQFPEAAVAVQSDGKIIGASEHADGLSWSLTRTNPDGTPDITFGDNGVAVHTIASGLLTNPVPLDIVVQADGKILVGGRVSTGAGAGEILARFNADGSLDTSFESDGVADNFLPTSTNGWVAEMAVLDDGKIVVAIDANGSTTLRVARLNPNGVLDSTFGDAGDGGVQTLAGAGFSQALTVLPDGKLLVVGNDLHAVTVTRLNANGTFDFSFGSGFATETVSIPAVSFINGIHVQPDGRIVVGLTAEFDGAGTDDNPGAFRLTADGLLDTSYGNAGTGIATIDLPFTDTTTSMVMHPDGGITLGGFTEGAAGDRELLLVRFTTDGLADPTIGVGGIHTHSAIASPNQLIFDLGLDPDGKLVVLAGWGDDFRLLRYHSGQELEGSAALDVTNDEVGPLTFTVDSLVDENDGDFSTGDLSLREAVALANISPGADTILFDASLANGTVTLGGTELLITEGVTITGLGAPLLTIDANDASRIFRIDGISNGPIDVEISGLTLTGGSADVSPNSRGGAIFNEEGNLTLRESVFTQNSAQFGGGIASQRGTLTVEDTTFTDNSASTGGGGIHVNGTEASLMDVVLDGNDAVGGAPGTGTGGAFHGIGSISSPSVLTFANVSVTNNTAGSGGGIELRQDVTLVMTNSLISGNQASAVNAGGGLFALFNVDVTIIASTITGNSADAGGGLVMLEANLRLENSTVSDNHATGNAGGGILFSDSSGATGMTIIGSTISGNTTAVYGGGVFADSGTHTIINSTISGNMAAADGGGIDNRGATFVIRSSTITGNRADSDGNASGVGGGIALTAGSGLSPTTLYNTIVAGNLVGASGSDAPDDVSSSSGRMLDANSAFNLIGNATTAGGLTDGVNGNIVGNSGTGTIPIGTILDTTLADNGGPTLTHALVADSPAIDAGDDAEAIDEDGLALTTDQRQTGFDRILDGDGDSTSTVDIGAFEAPEFVPPPALTVAIDMASISENGGIATGTVTRNTGTSGALVVTLLSSDTGEASVPVMVTIPDGQSSATFAISGVDDALVDGTQLVTITASASGFADGADTLDVTDDDVPTLTLSIDMASISENGGVATGTVTRNSGTVGDLVVALSSSDTGVATVPATVTILDGQTSVTFAVTAANDAIADGTQAVTITATAAGHAGDAGNLFVTDDEVPTLTVVVNADSISEGAGPSATTVTITRNTDPTAAMDVMLTSSDTGEATIVGMATIPAGQFSVTVDLNAIDDALFDGTQTVTITATEVVSGMPVSDATFGTSGVASTSLRNEIEYKDPEILVQPDGKTVVIGRHPTADDSWQVIRLGIDGTPDAGFAEAGIATTQFAGLTSVRPTGMVLHPDGKLTVIGRGPTGPVVWLLARYNPDGTPDLSFGDGGQAEFNLPPVMFSVVNDAVLNDDGSMILVGNVSGEILLARILPNGDLDTSFGSGGTIVHPLGTDTTVGVDDVVRQPDGKFVVAGIVSIPSNPTNDQERYYAARFNADGSLDTTFDSDGWQTIDFDMKYQRAEAVALQPNGKILIFGSVEPSSSTNRNWGLTRLNTDGSLDMSFGASGVAIYDHAGLGDHGHDFVVQPDGKILAVGGLFISGNGRDRGMVRFNADGTLDTGFGNNGAFVQPPHGVIWEEIWDAKLTPDGKLVTYSGYTTTWWVERFELPLPPLSASDTVDVTDDEVATLTLSIDMASISENSGMATGTVTRNTGTSGALVVTLMSNDAGEASVPMTVTIPDGQTSATFTISGMDDSLADGTQTVTITATAAGFVDGTDTIDITDNEVPTLALSIDLASISENGGSATGTVSRNTPTDDALVVTLMSSDTTEASVPVTVMIPAGQASAEFTISGVDDFIVDGTQTVTVTASATGFTSGMDSVDVTDGDTGPVTFVVDTLSDVVDGVYTAGQFSLREAVQLANASAGADTIQFHTSLAGGTITLGGTSLDLLDDVTITGLGMTVLTVDANDLSSVFSVAMGVTAEITDLTLANGDSKSAVGGGGIRSFGDLTLRRMTIRDSRTSLTSNGGGGGIYVQGGSLLVEDSHLHGNESNFGGGIAVGNGGSAEIVRTLLETNNATSGGGGGLRVITGAEATVSESTFSGNTSSGGFGRGGAIHSFGSLVVSGTTFSANVGRIGGAVSLGFNELSTQATITNSTISGNQSLETGGGLHVSVGVDLELVNSTLVGNHSDVGGGGGMRIAGGTVAMHNTIVAGNLFGTTSSANDISTVPGGLDPTSSHNLIGDAATSGGLSHGVNGNIVGNAGSGTIPLTTILNPTLADNGGPTLTHALVAGSLALDAGSNAAAVDYNGAALMTDQRQGAFARILDGDGNFTPTVDIGAFEAPTLPALMVTINAASISENGGTAMGTVTRNTGTSGALVVTLMSSDTGEASVPTMVTIPDGQSSATFTISGVDDALVDGTQAVTITASNSGFTDGTDTLDVTDDDAAGGPVVVQVLVSSSSWSTAFKTGYLGATDGFYPLPTGADQLTTLPWTIDQVRVVFDQDVLIDQDDMIITRSSLPGDPLDLVGFSHTGGVATWSVESVAVDKLLLNLNDQSITSPTGVLLDGEFTTGSGAMQSGDGTPGGAFRFRIDVLAGDADGSGQVDSGDVSPIVAALLTRPSDPNWDPFADMDASGQVDAGDVSPLVTYLLSTLPEGNPPEASFPPEDEVLSLLRSGDSDRRKPEQKGASDEAAASTIWWLTETDEEQSLLRQRRGGTDRGAQRR